MHRSRIVHLALTILVVLTASTAAALAGPPIVDPIRARASGWDAQAIGEMVFRHHSVPAWKGSAEYQCGIAAAMMSTKAGAKCAERCQDCDLGSGSPTEIKTMIEHYPRRVSRQLGTPAIFVSAHDESMALPPATLRANLTRKRPVVALLGARLGTPRAVLLVGYRDEPADMMVLLNDPSFEPTDRFWIDAGGVAGPSPGTWWLPYQALRGELEWDRSILISTTGEGEVPIPSGTPRSGG